MAEQSTIDFTKLEGVTPVTSQIESIQTETIPSNNQIDFSKLQGVTPVNSKTSTIDFSKLKGVTPVSSTQSQLVSTSTRQYTDAEKIRYGIDKQNTFFGNVYRVAKAGTQAAFDPDKEFKDYIQYNNQKEQLLLKQKYGDLASGSFEDDTVVQAAAMATMMLDPFYIAAYMTPWGRAASASLKGVSALSGVTVGLDTMLNNLATTGTVDAKSVGISAASGAVLGPLTVKAFSAIKTLLPSANNAQIQKIIGVVEGKKAKELGISQPEFKKLQKIAGDTELLALNKQLQIAGKNWIAPIAEQQKLFNATEKTLQNQIKKIQKGVKDIDGVPFFKQTKVDTTKELLKTLKIKNKTLGDKTKEFNLKQKELWKQTAVNERKLTDLVAKRDYTILKKLKEQKGLTRNLTEAVISASVRPSLGAATGYAFGRLWGDDDTNLNNWMMAGASLGALNKMIQRSGTVFATGEKNFLESIIFNNGTRLAFQKVRELTATTTSTKLKALGGETEKIGMKLFQEIDSPVSKFSASGIAERLKLDYSNRAFALVQGANANEQAAAIRIARGSKEKGTPKIQKLATDIRKYLDDFRKEYTDVGIGLRKEVIKGKKTITKRIDPIKDYFPRVWNWDAVKENPEKFKKVLTSIFKSKGNKKPDEAAESFYNSLSKHNEQGFYDEKAVQSLVNDLLNKKRIPLNRGLIRNLPLSDHIENERLLTGSYAQVEKVLSKNGYLIDDIPSIFTKLINSSADSIGFAKQFGAKGQLLNGYIQRIVNKYSGNPNAESLASKEIKLVMDSIDGFFGRYGQARQGLVKSGAGILSTISNLNMLDRVTIASLGDVVQPFTNSNNFLSFIKGLSQTALTAARETGLAKNLGLAQRKEINQALLKTLTPLDDASSAANIMGAIPRSRGEALKKNISLRGANELGFKVLGLQWLTGFARRYAYNVGAVDAYTSANKLVKFVNSRNSLSSAKGINLVNDVAKYGINTTDALKLGRATNFQEAIKTKFNKRLLNEAGIKASNRDALIPQVDNRLLFTQSRDPMVRLLGQFLSWTMAKSAQTNKILQRIENGDTKQLVKLLAGLPVYGGIQSLREISKYGEIQTDLETQTDKWFSESLKLSGMTGTLPELFLGRLTGPGARQPWYLFAPATSVATSLFEIPKSAIKGDTDKALQIFSEKIAPLPTWRKWIGKLFPDSEFSTSETIEKPINNRLKFNEGDIVYANDGFSNDSIVEQPFLGEAEVEASKKTLIPMAKPEVNKQMDSLGIVKEEEPTQLSTLPSNIDMEFLAQMEGNESKIYVPTYKKGIDNGKVIGTSGATIGMGFDLGARNVNDLKGLPLSIIEKLEPYLGLKNQEALEYVINNPLMINDEEKNIINQFAKKTEIEKLKTKWQETTGESFEDLDPRAATVIASVAFQHGDLLTKAPNFWKQVTTKDWSGAYSNLLDWDSTGKPSQTQSRREAEAKLLEGLFENKIKRVEKNLGGIIGKAISKQVTKALGKKVAATTTKNISTQADEILSNTVTKELSNKIKPGNTAITSTIGTYKKVNNMLTDLNKNNVLDFGAGIGIGTRQFTNKKVLSYEPFVPSEKILKSKIKFEGKLFKGRLPDYTNVDDILLKEGFGSKDAVVNLNVLNVIADKTQRANAVKNISQLIKRDGLAVITTRGPEVAKQADLSKNAIKFSDGFIFGKGSERTFQKGYSQKELESYIKNILGDMFSVEKIPGKYKIGTSGVVIRKIKGDK